MSRHRAIDAAPADLWKVVADPELLPHWWPGVERVEDASKDAWTAVLRSPRGGRSLRADYSLLEAEAPRLRRWRHEVEETPFERILRDSVTALELEPAEEGRTRVRLTTQLTPRGFSRLGGLQLRRATRRQLDGALDGLESIAESWRAKT